MSPSSLLHVFLQEHESDPELNVLLGDIGRAGKYVVHAIRNEGSGLSGEVNVQGEKQLKLDVLSDKIFCDHLSHNPAVAQFASEEQENLVEINGAAGKFSIAFDPLDGSSLVDSNMAIGSIFAIFKGNSLVGKKGKDMVAAGCLIYGPRTTFLYSCGNGVHRFMLNDIGEFQCCETNVTVEETAKIFAPGNLRAVQERPEYLELVKNMMNEPLTLRYSGGMVPDIHTIFCKRNGIFLYPASKKYPDGKLRLLYECAPFAFLMEQAGGSALNEKGERILDLEITELHQRTTIVIGSTKSVHDAVEHLRRS